jgi:hypothetical protein
LLSADGLLEYKLALRDYLIRKHPSATEKLELLSLRFKMTREIGENRMATAAQLLRTCVSSLAQLNARDSMLSRKAHSDLLAQLQAEMLLAMQVPPVVVDFLRLSKTIDCRCLLKQPRVLSSRDAQTRLAGAY